MLKSPIIYIFAYTSQRRQNFIHVGHKYLNINIGGGGGVYIFTTIIFFILFVEDFVISMKLFQCSHSLNINYEALYTANSL